MASKILMSCRRLCTFRQQSHRSLINNAAATTREATSKEWKNDMMAMCLIPLAFTTLTFVAYTATDKLSNSSLVMVNKKLAGTMSEVEQPDYVADEGSRYVNRSFRKGTPRGASQVVRADP